MASGVFVGIDVAKADYVVACRPSGVTWTACNDAPSIADTVARLVGEAPTLVVLEATGGYETALVVALATAGVLALVAERGRPAPRALPDAALQALTALVTRRRRLLDMLVAERNRLEHAQGAARGSVRQHGRWLERRVTEVDRDLDDTIRRRPVRRA